MTNLDLTVVIRTAGERTKQLCYDLVANQVPPEQIFVIEEKPFSQAVIKNFEIGIREGRTWTLALDADVLLAPWAIEELFTNVRNAPSRIMEKLYVYQGRILCKVFGKTRSAGVHLYRTDKLVEAIEIIKTQGFQLRPESATYQVMLDRGYAHVKDNRCYALHDYHQSYASLYRNGFFQARKHLSAGAILLQHWVNNMDSDPDYRVLLAGWNYGLESWHDKPLSSIDISQFEKLTEQQFSLLKINEKGELGDTEKQTIQQEIENLITRPTTPIRYRHNQRLVLPLAERISLKLKVLTDKLRNATR